MLATETPEQTLERKRIDALRMRESRGRLETNIEGKAAIKAGNIQRAARRAQLRDNLDPRTRSTYDVSQSLYNHAYIQQRKATETVQEKETRMARQAANTDRYRTKKRAEDPKFREQDRAYRNDFKERKRAADPDFDEKERLKGKPETRRSSRIAKQRTRTTKRENAADPDWDEKEKFKKKTGEVKKKKKQQLLMQGGQQTLDSFVSSNNATHDNKPSPLADVGNGRRPGLWYWNRKASRPSTTRRSTSRTTRPDDF